MLGEADTRAKPIDPGLHARGWTEDLISRLLRGDLFELPVTADLRLALNR